MKFILELILVVLGLSIGCLFFPAIPLTMKTGSVRIAEAAIQTAITATHAMTISS